MIISKSEVKMWTQKMTSVSREHTLWNSGGENSHISGGEQNFASEFRANFDATKGKPADFSAVKNLLATLEATAQKYSDAFDASGSLRLKLLLLWMLLMRLFASGEEQQPEHRKSIFDLIAGSGGTGKAGEVPATRTQSASQPAENSRRGGLQGETEVSTREWLFFEAHGKVTTQDGKDIPIDIRLKLHDEQVETLGLTQEGVRALIDPLVINYANDSVKLTDEKFQFDLDADGVPEGIAVPASGSAFLALDRNGDGIINDGSELFGVTLGDGFAELAQFDDDKNGFIDEGDRIYEQLSLFTKYANGKDVVFTLREKGVKAISLENLATALRLADGAAQLRKTGFIVRENNTASTVQHIDLRPEPVPTSQNSILSVRAAYSI